MKFKVGDVCITQGSRMSLLNDGAVVVILQIDPTVHAANGDAAPYLIRRIDGQLLAYTSCRHTGADRFYRLREAWCRESRLRRFDEPSPPPKASSASPDLAAKQRHLLDLLAKRDADPNRPETESDGLRAEAIRRLRVRGLIRE